MKSECLMVIVIVTRLSPKNVHNSPVDSVIKCRLATKTKKDGFKVDKNLAGFSEECTYTI